MNKTDFEMYLLNMWKDVIDTKLYKYKHRVKAIGYNGKIDNAFELFLDVTNGEYFKDIKDLADGVDLEDALIGIDELIMNRKMADKKLYKVTVRDEADRMHFENTCEHLHIHYSKYPHPINWAYSIKGTLTDFDIKAIMEYADKIEDMPMMGYTELD